MVINNSLIVIILMFVLSLFGTKAFSKIVTITSGKHLDYFRIISLLISGLRLANESYDLVFNDPKESYEKVSSSRLTDLAIREKLDEEEEEE
jgi:hypothetical protein